MTVWLATNLVAAALLPPSISALLLAAGLILQCRRPRLATSPIVLATGALYALSTSWVGGLLQKSLEISAPLLKRHNIRRIVLAPTPGTCAVPLFESQGLNVIPTGLQFSGTRIDSILDLLPTPAGLRDSTFALHEWLGILWYKLRSIFAEGTP
jgi:uncharacterized SAM-binding protein YcdF (DUF218 family)